MDKIYTTRDVAAMYNLAEPSVRSYIFRGQLPATKYGNTFLMTEEDLKAWEKTRKPKPRKKGKV